VAGIKQITDVIYLNLSIAYYYIEISRFRRAAAPMNDPKAVVYLAIDNPKNTIQYGGVVTVAPI
jgi:hypothetical protein